MSRLKEKGSPYLSKEKNDLKTKRESSTRVSRAGQTFREKGSVGPGSCAGDESNLRSSAAMNKENADPSTSLGMTLVIFPAETSLGMTIVIFSRRKCSRPSCEDEKGKNAKDRHQGL